MSEINNKIPEAVTEWAHEGTDYLIDQMKESMDGPKSGKIYGSHQASAPGESPAIRDRGLIDSIDRDKQFLKGTAFSRNPVAVYMEEGTKDKDGNQIVAARPLWEKTLELNRIYLKTTLYAKIKGAENHA